MSQASNLKNVVEDIVSSYEERIQTISSIFDATHLILSDFQESILDTKEEREKINTQLRDILAKNEHLRRKDFDNMMQSVLSIQDEREKEVKNSLKSYLNEQKEMAQALRGNLSEFRDSLAKGEVQRVEDFRALIKDIFTKQEMRKEEVSSKLKEFQKEQQETAKRLKELLAKGTELRIKHLKLMLRQFNAQRKERLARQKERREEVEKMLGEFKNERVEAAKNWQAVQQKKRAQRRAFSPEAINIDAQKSSGKKNASEEH